MPCGAEHLDCFLVDVPIGVLDHADCIDVVDGDRNCLAVNPFGWVLVDPQVVPDEGGGRFLRRKAVDDGLVDDRLMEWGDGVEQSRQPQQYREDREVSHVSPSGNRSVPR